MNTLNNSSRSVGITLGLNVLLGLWLILSPFVLGPAGTAILWNNIAIGIAVILVALEARRFGSGIRGIGVLLGAWLFASPFVLNFRHTVFLWNNLILAFLVIAAALASQGVVESRGEFSR